MDNQQLKSYRFAEWKLLRQRIIQRDGGCVDCGKTEADGVKLQVHHLCYHEGHKAHEYTDDELETLCQGCHAKRHGHIPPDFGWEYDGMEDLEDECGECDLCGTSLRYEHHIYHKKWGYMVVGCECADRLTRTKEAAEKEKKYKALLGKRNRFVKSPKWKQRKNGNFISLDGYHIQIWENKDFERKSYFIIGITFQLPNCSYDSIIGKQKFHTLESAKRHIFTVIKDGSVDKYVRKKKAEYIRERQLEYIDMYDY